MLTGQIGVCLNPRPISFGALVARVTKSPAYHCITAISETECVSPEWRGALVKPISHFDDVVWTRFAYTAQQRQDVVVWATQRIGRPYAWLDDVIIGVHDLTGYRIPPLVAHWLSADIFYQCSELAACAVFFGAGLRPFHEAYPGEVSPADWGNYIVEQGWDKASVTTH